MPLLATNVTYAIAALCGFALRLPAVKVVAVTIAVIQAALVLLMLWPELRRRFLNSPAGTEWSVQLTHACRVVAVATFATFGAYVIAGIAAATAAAVVVLHTLRARVAKAGEQAA